MRKGIILLTVLLLPITIYLIFAVSTIHYVPVHHFGPRSSRIITVNGNPKTDSVYHTIGAFEYKSSEGQRKSDALKGRMYIASFIAVDSVRNRYNCSALEAYYRQNKGDLDTLHFVFFYPLTRDTTQKMPEFGDTLKIVREHSITFYADPNDLDYLKKDNYFKRDPKDIKAPWKSDMDLILVDTKGSVRGYYDGRFVPEISRMVEDIKHIKFHDESAGMEEKYTPKKKDK